jgi:hypothetical protein
LRSGRCETAYGGALGRDGADFVGLDTDDSGRGVDGGGILPAIFEMDTLRSPAIYGMALSLR